VIAIIPERVIGMPRNTDRHRPESPLVIEFPPHLFNGLRRWAVIHVIPRCNYRYRSDSGRQKS